LKRGFDVSPLSASLQALNEGGISRALADILGQCSRGHGRDGREETCDSQDERLATDRRQRSMPGRPHEGLDMKCPAECYTASARPYAGLPELTYPFHDRDIVITACGRLCLHRKKINISVVLAGQKLGIKEVDEGIWLVSFMHYDLGYFDLEQRTLQPLNNPFGTRLSPIS